MKKLVTCLFPILLMISACGNSGGLGQVFDMNEPWDVDTASYLPLDGGIVTKFPNSIASSEEGVQVENLKVEVINGGYVQVTGKKKYEDGSVVNVSEILLLEESNGQILLKQYYYHLDYSDTEYVDSVRTFTPPVVLLHDKNNVDVGDYYSSLNVSVDYSKDKTGEDERVTFVDGDSVNTSVAANLSGVELGISVDAVENVQVGGYDTEVYHIDFSYVPGNIWFPTEGIIRGEIGVSKGMGIISLAGQHASDSNAIEYILGEK